MQTNNKLAPVPKEGGQDYALRAFQGGLSAFPLVGGLMGELLTMCIEPNFQKRMKEWMESVNALLNELMEKGISKEEIFQNEAFQSLFLKTSKIYLENVEEYKKPVLIAALNSSMNPDIKLEKKYIFLDIINELTESHLLILRDIGNNEKLLEKEGYLYQIGLENTLAEKYAEGDTSYFNLLKKKLEANHLLNYCYAEPRVVINGRAQWHLTLSAIGKEFLTFLYN